MHVSSYTITDEARAMWCVFICIHIQSYFLHAKDQSTIVEFVYLWNKGLWWHLITKSREEVYTSHWSYIYSILNQGLGRTRILLTCNDLKNQVFLHFFLFNFCHGNNEIMDQCLEEPRKLSLCGLDPWSLHKPDRFQDSTNTELVNILKVRILISSMLVQLSSLTFIWYVNIQGGIVYANKVTIPFISQNIKSGNHGQSLDSTLALHK